MSRKKLTPEEKAERKKEYNKKWRQENKEKTKKYNKKWREKNKERIKEYNKKWSQENEEKVRRYRQENEEKRKTYGKRYYQENREVYYAFSAKRRALKKEQACPTSCKEAIRKIYEDCMSLNNDFGYRAFEVDHIIPLSKGGLHHQDNLQIIQKEYNRFWGGKVKPDNCYDVFKKSHPEYNYEVECMDINIEEDKGEKDV